MPFLEEDPDGCKELTEGTFTLCSMQHYSQTVAISSDENNACIHSGILTIKGMHSVICCTIDEIEDICVK